MKIIKRNGNEVEFDRQKIINAITKANNTISDDAKISTELINNIAEKVWTECKGFTHIPQVEEVQDLVEKYLFEFATFKLAKTYTNYRYKRELERNNYKKLMTNIGEKLTASNVQNQNANIDEYSFGGRIGEANDVMMKEYALNYCMSKMARENHLNNEIYIHDLNSYAVGMHNCLSIPLDKLLAKGFNTRQTDVRPANSISTAFQLAAVIMQIQSLQQFGGVSYTHLDWSMVPYVRKSFYKHWKNGIKYLENFQHINEIENVTDVSIENNFYKQYPQAYKYAMDMTIKEAEQAAEGMYHNLNTLQSRSGCQLPFSSINYGTCTLEEGRIIIKALLDASIKGVGKFHKTSIFPCGIFQLGKGINREEGDPNYDLYKLALKSTAKRLYPNYANIDWSGNKGYDKNDPRTYFSTMGKCKLQLI